MNDFFSALSNYGFMQNAVLAALLASISCGIIGSYVVAKRMVFISGGITHASFGGVGLAYFLGINPLIGALAFSILSALGIRVASRYGEIREDSAIGILWSLGMALGIIFIFMTPGYSPNLMTYLFGSILTVTGSDLLLMLMLAVITVLIFTVFYRIILYVAFDEEYARSHKIPVELVNNLLLILISLAIVFNIRVIGIILVISFLSIPQSIANLLVFDMRKIMLLSVIISFAGSFIGLWLSYFWNIPAGATIISVFVAIYLFVRLIQWMVARLNRISK